MKLFLRGGVSLITALFAAFLIFYARPLLAETTPSQGLSAQEQQETKAPAQAAQQKKEAEAKTTAQAETAELSATVSGTPSATAVKDNDATAAVSIKTVNSTEPNQAPLTAPQAYIAFSYSLCCRCASGLGVRRGTIAADPRILPFGTRVYLTGGGSYDGEYLVTDSGTAIKGNKIDVWVPTIQEARRFGRKNVKLTVLSYGGKKKRQK
ncbi:MAG: 3D domain-containing protein [Acidobacteriota bacterium]|nr:3D domain-containing protein [Acidobacteriota bacterium]